MLLSSDTRQRRIAIYVRVSTEEQYRDGYSFDAQKRKLVEHCERMGWTTKSSWIYSDRHTGSDLARHDLSRLREDVRAKKYDAVLVWKIDRLSRNLKHLLTIFEELKDHGASFISFQENLDFQGPIGNLIFQIFGAIAQFERELIKGRTHMGRVASAEMGNYTGAVIPYGYEAKPNPSGRGKKLILVEEERKWVEQIFVWYAHENLGYRQIAKRLNDNQVQYPKPRSNRTKYAAWTEKILRNIITNPLYKGEFVANRTTEDGSQLPADEWTIVKVPACVSMFLYEQAQRARERHTSGQHTDYLLSGKIYDMTLPTPRIFVGAKRHGEKGYDYRRNQFTDEKGQHIPSFSIPMSVIEDAIWQKIYSALKNPEAFIEAYFHSQNQTKRTSAISKWKLTA